MVLIKTGLKIIPEKCKHCKYSKIESYSPEELAEMKKNKISDRVCTLLGKNLKMVKVGINTYRNLKPINCPLIFIDDSLFVEGESDD